MEVIALFARALHSKIEYDSLWGRKVFNWAKALARYVIPEDFKRGTEKKFSKYKSPFEVYFAYTSLVTILTKLLYILDLLYI